MNWRPRTIFSQISIGLLCLLLINTLTFIIFLRYFAINPSATQFADMLNYQLQLLQIELQHLTIEQAQLWLLQHLPNSDYEIRQITPKLSPLPNLHFYKLIQQTLIYHHQQHLNIHLSYEMG